MLVTCVQDLVSRFIQNMGIHKQAVLRLGWLLFLTARDKLLPTFPDLVRYDSAPHRVQQTQQAHAIFLPMLFHPQNMAAKIEE